MCLSASAPLPLLCLCPFVPEKKDMLVLGISGNLHDSAVALVEDGRILFAIEEERLSRQKYASLNSFPVRAIRYTLDRAGLSPEDLDEFAFFWNGAKHLAPTFAQGLGYLRRPSRDLFYHYVFRVALAGIMRLTPGKQLASLFPDRRLPPVRFVEHHLAHLGGSFPLSGFDEAAVCVVDGMGELYSTSLYRCEGRRIETVRRIRFPHSLGTVYQAVTEHLGFRPVGDEYKVMGLAAYGGHHAPYEAFFEKLIVLDDEGGFRVDTDLVNFHLTFGMYKPLLSARGQEALGSPRRPGEPIDYQHRSIAWHLQKRLEDALFHVLRRLRLDTGSPRLVLAGGVALNCAANGKIRSETGFEEVFVPPAPSDAGAALGAALYRTFYPGGRVMPAPLRSALLGPSYSDEEVRSAVERARLRFRVVDQPAEYGAELLAGGKIIGWFQGRMEFGPRALGARSILADPRPPDMAERVNRAVKNRETFRPFAPAVLGDRAAEIFEDPDDSPFMSFAGRLRPESGERLPAVTHADGTGRLQTVSRETGGPFYSLIEAFHRRTGVPAILNTSFNVRDEPIVCTPVEAIRCFCGTGLDALLIGSYLLEKGRL